MCVVRTVAIEHFKENNSQTPNISFSTIFLSLENFWSLKIKKEPCK
jgi:hypothetical protein